MNKPKKILILGSGALKIGEAGEFDYSGSQAIKAIKEEGIKTVLVNPNIATIQTSRFLADTIYFLPVNDFFVEKIIEKEKPDGILLSFGGQTALNCGLKLYKKKILAKHNVQVLGTPVEAIDLTEDRDKFAKHLHKIGISTPQSHVSTSKKQAFEIAETIGYPVMIRAGFALGGQGSGIAKDKNELETIAEKAFAFVSQILVEQYLHHFKEVEYEVVRDQYDNCFTVCNMENFDPLGIHTGESIVVAPSQTLNNFEYHALRTKSIEIVRSLGIVGECNVQFALNPNPTRKVSKAKNESTLEVFDTSDTFDTSGTSSLDYYVIEVNARLSRSSALASKATGYPLAYVAAKLALGKNVTEVKNKVTNITQSCFEPALDYIVVKIPRWDIEKFKGAEERIGTGMKSVGEVMGIGRTFEEAFQKSIRMLDLDLEGVTSEKLLVNGYSSQKTVEHLLEVPTPKRMFAISKALRQNMSVKKIYALTGIDPWFLERIKNIVDHEKQLMSRKSAKEIKRKGASSTFPSPFKGEGQDEGKNLDQELTKQLLLELKQLGFSDKRIGELLNLKGLDIREKRKQWGIIPSVLQIDTLAGEFPAQTNYLYLTYNAFHNDIRPTNKKGIIVLGSGPYRIGSSVEFDWTSVNTVLSLKKHNKEAIIINCNPETVSTDYDISDKLYFEELTFERIADIYEFENPGGIIISVGGQTPNNRAHSLQSYGFHILGTDPRDIDRAEDRSKFSKLLDKLDIAQPAWNKFSSVKDALKFCNRVGYPVLLRPSFVLSGTAMKICHNEEELSAYLKKFAYISQEYPITVSKFITDAKEIELDAVAQHGIIKTFIISEHVENAGVHSGDATIVLPAQNIYVETQKRMKEIAVRLAESLKITGPFNIQFLAKDNTVQVIEINLRSSRTFPFISKVTGVNFIDVAVDAFFGKLDTSHTKQSLSSRGGTTKDHLLNTVQDGISQPLQGIEMTTNGANHFVATKVAQFSFSRLTGADPVLHVEMASTGEVACFGDDIEEAFLKGDLSVGGKIPTKGIFISLGGDENKMNFLEGAQQLATMELPIYATEKTSDFLRKNGIKTKRLYKIHEHKTPNILTAFSKGKIDLAINISDTNVKRDIDDDYAIRRSAVDHNIPLFTNIKKAELFAKAITTKKIEELPIKSWDEYTLPQIEPSSSG